MNTPADIRITRTESFRSEYVFTTTVDGDEVASCRNYEDAERAIKTRDRGRIVFEVAS